MKQIIPSFIFLLFFITAQAQSQQLEDFNAIYDSLLAKHLQPQVEREGIILTLVDYRGWSQDPKHQQAMEQLSVINPAELDSADAMAYWINAYNLLTIDLIVKTKEKRSIKNQGGIFVGVWKKHTWRLYDADYSLHRIEHNILRPKGDSRIHFAINCASLSCPDLRAEPYVGELLDWQLEEQQNSFINNPTKGVLIAGGEKERIRVSEIGTRIPPAGEEIYGKEKVKISAIFIWYMEDFGGREGVRSLIKKYKNANLSKMTVIPYDWSLNGDW